MLFGKSLSATDISNLREQTLNPSNGEEYLISHWKLDEGNGSNISDSKGNNHGTAANVGWTSGMIGAAIVCNGTSSNINIANHSSLNPTEEISMMAWVKTFENKTTKIAQKGDWDGHGLGQGKWDGWNVHVRTADNVSHSLHWGDGLPQFDTWYHLAMTYDGSTLKMFVNGQLKNSKALTGALKVNTRAFSIGSDNAAQKFLMVGLTMCAITVKHSAPLRYKPYLEVQVRWPTAMAMALPTKRTIIPTILRGLSTTFIRLQATEA